MRRLRPRVAGLRVLRQDILTTWSWPTPRSPAAPADIGIHEEDIRHALRNIIAVADDLEDADVTLFLSPDRAVHLLEIGVLATEDGPLIIHAMAARTHRFGPLGD